MGPCPPGECQVVGAVILGVAADGMDTVTGAARRAWDERRISRSTKDGRRDFAEHGATQAMGFGFVDQAGAPIGHDGACEVLVHLGHLLLSALSRLPMTPDNGVVDGHERAAAESAGCARGGVFDMVTSYGSRQG